MRPVLLAILVLLAVTSAANAAPRQDPDGFTPIVQRVVAPPWPVNGSDGRFHLVYEVQLLNTIPVPWRVTGVTVRSTRGPGRALASWRGRGQLLGRVGNSGNSSAPHLHIHVVNRNAIFGANGLPYVFSGFDVTGRVATTEAFDRAEATGDPVQLRRVRTGIRRNELPLDQVIVTWPG